MQSLHLCQESLGVAWELCCMLHKCCVPVLGTGPRRAALTVSLPRVALPSLLRAALQPLPTATSVGCNMRPACHPPHRTH